MKWNRLALFSVGLACGNACATSSVGGARTDWSVKVLGDTGDPRFVAVTEAAEFWNHELAAIGASFRLGPIMASPQRLPEHVLLELSTTVLARERARPPAGFAQIEGDIVIAFSGSADLTSFGINPARFGGRGLVVLRPGHLPPLSLPNVARNVAAHEIGHVLGLRHNDRPGTLMCMPPAPCRPLSFRADTIVFFPLTDTERHFLAREFVAGGRPRSRLLR